MALAGGKIATAWLRQSMLLRMTLPVAQLLASSTFFFCGQVAIGDCVSLPSTPSLTMPPVHKADASSVIGEGKPNMAAMIFFKQYFRC